MKVVAILLLAVAIIVVFWQQFAGLGVYIGESDRLNSYLNMRLVEYDALKEYGRVPAWNPNLFGGFSTAASHWMNLGTDPIAYLLQLFPRGEVFRALSFVSISFLLAACFTAFLYIRDVTSAQGASVIGGLAYGLSVFSIHRASQVDNAELTVVLIPLGLLALRRARPDNLVGPAIGLTLVTAALAYWGFLQEVAYAFLFFGCYALYRAAVLRPQGTKAALAPIAVMAAACLVALVFAAPRLITIQQEFLSLSRTTMLHYYDYPQVLRFFHEGIYGRSFEEGRLLGHGMNLNEGLQLVSSTALVLFVCLGILRPRSSIETFGAIAFFALFGAMLPSPDLLYSLVRRFVPNPLPFPLSLNCFKVLLYGSLLLLAVFAFKRSEPYLRIGAGLRKLTPTAPRPTDTSFHLVALTAILFPILVYEGTYVVYRLFGRADFTHMRLSILALLPLCTLFAVYLAELRNLPIYDNVRSGLGKTLPILLILAGGGLAYLIHGPLLDHLIARDIVKIYLLDHNEIMPTVLVRILLTAVLIVSLAVAIVFVKAKSFDLQSAASIAIGAFVVVEVLTYAHFKVNGPQTWTYPVPFRMFNYFNAPPSALRPPDNAKLADFRNAFDVENHRLMVLSDDVAFPGTKVPHIAEFWRARTIGGYGTGVSQRLASLPWPKDVQTLRTIDFTSVRNLNASVFPLLAFLNVKYLLVLTPEVYFNVPPRDLPDREQKQSLAIGDRDYALRTMEVDGIPFRVFENPVKPLPRHFLVEQVVGSDDPPDPATRPVLNESGIRLFRDQVDDLTRTSFVERNFVGTTRKFDTSGDLSVSYRGDIIDVRVTPSARERFLVLSETYNPQWRVYAGGVRTATIPTNLVMNGVLIPAGLDHVEVRFEPFSSQRLAFVMMAAALCGFILFIVLLWQVQRRRLLAQ